jgi:hypothetical protein
VATDYRACLPELLSRDLLPPDRLAVYAGGSLVRGWGNASSDLDIYVITTQRCHPGGAQTDTVALEPDSVPALPIYVGDRRWDIEYWLDSQVDQLLGKVSRDILASDEPAGRRMTDAEIGHLQRLSHAAPIEGDDWLGRRREQFAASAADTVMTLRALHFQDIYAEDATGQLAAGDVSSSVLSVKLAFRYAIEALLASCGEFGESPKWFARRFQAAKPQQMSFEEYWAIETMRTFDPAAPEKWVEEVLRACQRIASEVSI